MGIEVGQEGQDTGGYLRYTHEEQAIHGRYAGVHPKPRRRAGEDVVGDKNRPVVPLVGIVGVLHLIGEEDEQDAVCLRLVIVYSGNGGLFDVAAVERGDFG